MTVKIEVRFEGESAAVGELLGAEFVKKAQAEFQAQAQKNANPPFLAVPSPAPYPLEAERLAAISAAVEREIIERERAYAAEKRLEVVEARADDAEKRLSAELQKPAFGKPATIPVQFGQVIYFQGVEPRLIAKIENDKVALIGPDGKSGFNLSSLEDVENYVGEEYNWKVLYTRHPAA